MIACAWSKELRVGNMCSRPGQGVMPATARSSGVVHAAELVLSGVVVGKRIVVDVGLVEGNAGGEDVQCSGEGRDAGDGKVVGRVEVSETQAGKWHRHQAQASLQRMYGRVAGRHSLCDFGAEDFDRPQ